MRHIQKPIDSEVLQRNLTYKKKGQRPELRKILEREQNGFCAYTDKHFKSEASTIDHFKPQSQLQEGEDGYHNWFAVSYTVNVLEKRAKWKTPILHPNDPTIEERIWYKEEKNDSGKTIIVCEYAPDDKAAKNFVEIINLNKNILAEERAASLSRLRKLKTSLGMEGIKAYLKEEPLNIDFHHLTEWELNTKIYP